MNTRTRMLALVALIGPLVHSAGAQAYEVYDLPGTSCVANGAIRYTSFGKALNDTSEAQTFLCPMLRGDPDDDSIDDIFVRVEDQRGQNVDVECFVRTCYEKAGCITNPQGSSTGIGEQSIALTATAFENGDALLVCTVPAKGDAASGILNYHYGD